jgi:hypothetical protein
MEEKRKQEQHQLEMAKEAQLTQAEIAAQDVKTAAEIRRERAKAGNEPETTAE